MKFSNFFKQTYGSTFSRSVVVHYRNELANTNNLGALSGVDLDSGLFSGYIYYWDNGYLDFMVFNHSEGKDEIPITVLNTEDFQQTEVIGKILKFFR